jgi:hypothetical protein
MSAMLKLTLSPVRRFPALLAACALLPVSGLLAGQARVDNSKDKSVPQTVMDEFTPLNQLDIEGSYVGKAEFHTHSVNDQDQEEFQESIQYAHRFHLFGRVYLKLGASYERFDFNTTDTPLPSSLQSLAGVVALEYIAHGQPGAFITSKPGVYYSDSDSISTANFDFPTSIGAIVPLSKKFYLLVGIHTSILSEYPVLPIGGVIWLISDHLRLEAVPPEPKLIYTVNEKLDFFVGGEILGDAYKRDHRTSYKDPGDRRFNGGVISYNEVRVGGGVTYTPIKQVDINVAGGWMLGRSFNYYRGDEKDFNTNGAPYAKVSINAEF